MSQGEQIREGENQELWSGGQCDELVYNGAGCQA